jgi:hypothetical protein
MEHIWICKTEFGGGYEITAAGETKAGAWEALSNLIQKHLDHAHSNDPHGGPFTSDPEEWMEYVGASCESIPIDGAVSDWHPGDYTAGELAEYMRTRKPWHPDDDDDDDDYDDDDDAGAGIRIR